MHILHILQSVTEQWRSPARALSQTAVIQRSEIVHTDTLMVHNLPEIKIALKLQFMQENIVQKSLCKLYAFSGSPPKEEITN